MTRNLVLAGFMGTGKTTIGRLVAQLADVPFIDTDWEIERVTGRKIADIFAHDGEAEFRRLEARVCLQAASGQDTVIATGGGALLNPEVYEAFANSSLLVCLSCDLDETIRRVGHTGSRPLFAADRERLAHLLAQRASLYNRLPYQIDTTNRPPSEVAEKVLALWKQYDI